MSSENKKVVTRFAPSPTGFMHVGNLRTGLFAWLWARKNNGTFILRIEDTDKKREVEGSLEHIKKALRWIGMNWDEGPDVGGPHVPYIQSERMTNLNIYEKYAQKLIESGFAYASLLSEEEIETLRKQAEEEKRPFLFREHRPENTPEWKPGMPLRFKITELKRTVWHDVVRGELSAGPEALDDFILIKSDGYPTYNFAHIVDDIEMGVTHVIRGQEFISSTPNYIAVYEALGAPQPQYVTAPPIMGEAGNKKMGKRDGAKDVLEYQREGYLPEAMCNFLAFLGWNPGGEKEIYTLNELIEIFDISKIQKSGAQFNEEKLDWMNKEHIKKLSADEQFAKLLEYLPEDTKSLPQYSEAMLRKIMPLILERIEKWGDIATSFSARVTLAETEVETSPDPGSGEQKVSPTPGVGEGDFVYFFKAPEVSKDMLFWKEEKDAEKTKERLGKVLELISNADESKFADADTTKTLIWDYANTEGRGQVLWPTRVALSGREKSSDPFTLLSLLGKEESISRIKKAIEVL